MTEWNMSFPWIAFVAPVVGIVIGGCIVLVGHYLTTWWGW